MHFPLVSLLVIRRDCTGAECWEDLQFQHQREQPEELTPYPEILV